MKRRLTISYLSIRFCISSLTLLWIYHKTIRYFFLGICNLYCVFSLFPSSPCQPNSWRRGMYHFLVKVFFMFSYSCTTCISDLTKVFYCDIPSVRIALTFWCMTVSKHLVQIALHSYVLLLIIFLLTKFYRKIMSLNLKQLLVIKICYSNYWKKLSHAPWICVKKA